MAVAIDRFCQLVRALRRPNAEKALAILWYLDSKQADVAKSAGELARIMVDHHVGAPNSTRLANDIRSTKLASESKRGFSLRPGSRPLIRAWLPASLADLQPQIDHSAGFLPEPVWTGTRPWIESVCLQINGCVNFSYNDAALVMIRRLFETLIIEAYEHLRRAAEIQDGSGNFYMFGDLVDRATGNRAGSGTPALSIGRNTKRALQAVKALGDRSAHERRFTARAADLEKIHYDVRAAAEDLIALAALKRP